MAIRRTTISVTGATGGAGAATANAVSGDIISGEILAVYLKYVDSPPALTTDVALEGANTLPKIPVLTVSNAATDGWFFPLAQAKNQAAVDIVGMGAPIPMDDYVRATISGANDGDGVTVTVIWEND